MPSDDDSSDTPLTKALQECQRPADAAAAADVDDAAAVRVRRSNRNHWRRRLCRNSGRRVRIGQEALGQIQERLGRVPKKKRGRHRSNLPRAELRDGKAGSYTRKIMIEMAIPDLLQVARTAKEARAPLPNSLMHAAACGVSDHTLQRARGLALGALSDHMEQKLLALARACRDGHFPGEAQALKISWDETSLRFYCPLETLKALTGCAHIEPRLVVSRRPRGQGAAAEVREVKTGTGKPSYVVQVMQTAVHALLGRTSGEIVCRPTLCSSTSMSDLYSALRPWLRIDLLTTASPRPTIASQLVCLAADSHPSNKVLITKVALDTPEEIPIVDGMCLGHQISLSLDDMLVGMKSEIDIINPLYATKKLLQQLQPRNAIYRAIDKLAADARVIRGVVPPPEFREHAQEVVRNSLGDGVKETLYTLRNNGSREFGEKEEAMVSNFVDKFNGNWESDEWQHYCYTSPTDRRPCCRNASEARDKLKSTSKSVFQLVVWDKLDEGKKKWGDYLRRSSKCSFLTGCHRTLPQAVSKAWAPRGGACRRGGLRRACGRRHPHQEEEEAQQQGSAALEEQQDTFCFHGGRHQFQADPLAT